MITIEELVLASRLSASVGPFTLRRLFLRARIFASDGYSAADVQAVLGWLLQELLDTLSSVDVQIAERDLRALIAREEAIPRPLSRS